MQSIILKRKSDKKEVECKIQILDKNNLRQVAELEELIVQNLPSRELFQDDTDDLLLDCLGRRGFGYGVIEEKNLVAFAALYFPGDREENLGLDISLKKEDLPLVAHIETIMVLPDYRGNGLQVTLNKMLIEEAKKRGFKHILATVSPKNHVSHSNLEKIGMKAITTKIKFGDKLRDIMYMKI